MNMNIAENIALAALPKFGMTPLQLINEERLTSAAAAVADLLGIKVGSISQPAKNLSGGNQQKVVLAKWLMSRAGCLPDGRADAGHRRGGKARDLFDHRPPRRRRRRRTLHLF